MDSRFIEAFGGWYLVILDVLLIVGVICFFRLPKVKRVNSYYWLPFLILAFTFVYENIGAYTNYNFEFNKTVNAFLGNPENPRYNLWLFNIANKQISTILYLFLIKSWIESSKKKYINWMIILFIIVALILQLTGIEPLYLNQPIIFAMGANMILLGSGLYFIGLITNDKYLETTPFRLVSFWQMTFILFTYSLTYINYVAVLYLFEINPQLGRSIA
ncbi:histidine kinase, partial [Algoriphagus sp.]|uniref:histidine kinase n=1 Tax=Algoriphagus sp. TaxID=1872435 RepID=UPI0025E194DD